MAATEGEAEAGASLLRHAYLFTAFLLITGFGAAAALLPVAPSSPDMVNALIPWMKAVRAGGLDSISGEFAIYTPGSRAGLPISLLQSFTAPPPAIRDDAEMLGERAGSTATSLLSLAGAALSVGLGLVAWAVLALARSFGGNSVAAAG